MKKPPSTHTSSRPRPGDVVIETLEKYAAPGRATTPVLFKGRQGTSKTHQSRLFGRSRGFGKFIEVGGHRGLESFDLLGHFVLKGRSATWKDGPLSEAWRYVGSPAEESLAEALERGRTAFLLLDEVYRIAAREREMFLSSLQPETIAGIPCYKLRTGRPLETDWEGVSREEVLYAPVSLLSVAATTNVGLEYDVEEDCPAGRERWLARYIHFDDEYFLGVVRQHLELRKLRVELAWKFLDLYHALENGRRDGHLRGGLSLRTAVRIIECAGTEKDLAPTILEVLEICVDANADGEPLADQAEALRAATEAAGFGKTTKRIRRRKPKGGSTEEDTLLLTV